MEVPEGAVKAGSNLHGYYVQVSGEKIRCDSPEEAMYIQYAAGNGHRRIEVPLDEKVLKKAVKEYGKLLKDAEKTIIEFVESSISSNKLRRRLKGRFGRGWAFANNHLILHLNPLFVFIADKYDFGSSSSSPNQYMQRNEIFLMNLKRNLFRGDREPSLTYQRPENQNRSAGRPWHPSSFHSSLS